MLFSNWKWNALAEALFCAASTIGFYFSDYWNMFALSLVFLFGLVPLRAIKLAIANKKSIKD